MKRAWLAVAAVLMAGSAVADARVHPSISDAKLILPTDRYDHGVLGDAVEWGGIAFTVDRCGECKAMSDAQRFTTKQIVLPETRVFEDVEVRLVDLDGDGLREMLVVETDLALGASLAVYDAEGKRRAATFFIGQPHRWLAPAGIGDFDGDGGVEIAYIDRPHLARELVFVRLEGDRLVEIARAKGFTNHRIGDTTISGGTRRCGGRDSLIVATSDWSGIADVTLTGRQITVRGTAKPVTPANLQRAMACAD